MEKVSKTNPLITVIVPVYKVEEYINRCIDSIINQTYRNLEIILVDDGSPDKCGDICDEYAKKDKRVKVIHKENGGLSDARNAGIEIATGDYIGFVDSDDYISTEMYEKLLDIIIAADADVSVCKTVRFKDKPKIDKKYDKKIKVYTSEEYMKKFFKIGSQECVYYAWNKLYKRDIIEVEQYPFGLTSEDVLGTYKALLKSNKIVEINYPYHFYFYNENGITGGKFSKRDFDLLKIWDEVVFLSKLNNKYVDYAILNRNRINYTLLMRMALKIDYSEIIDTYKNECEELLTNLRKNKKELLNSRIPITRKITLIMMLKDYKKFCNMCKIARR